MQPSITHHAPEGRAPATRWQFEVTASDIRRFCQAIGMPEPLRAADDDGDAALIAPPLFCQAMAYRDVPPWALPPDGSPLELRAGPPEARVMGGASDFTVHRPVRAGETVQICSEVLGITRKSGRSGVLDLVEVRTQYTDADGRPLATEVATYVKRS